MAEEIVDVVALRKAMYARTNDLRDACRDLDKRLDALRHEVELKHVVAVAKKSPVAVTTWCAIVGAGSIGIMAVTVILAAMNG